MQQCHTADDMVLDDRIVRRKAMRDSAGVVTAGKWMRFCHRVWPTRRPMHGACERITRERKIGSRGRSETGPVRGRTVQIRFCRLFGVGWGGAGRRIVPLDHAGAIGAVREQSGGIGDRRRDQGQSMVEMHPASRQGGSQVGEIRPGTGAAQPVREFLGSASQGVGISRGHQ